MHCFYGGMNLIFSIRSVNTLYRARIAMFDDDLPKPIPESVFPRNLVDLSVSDLQDYITELEEEIEKVKADIEKKKASEDAAAAFFK